MSLGQHSKDLLQTVAAMLGNRSELLSLEFAEERERLVSAVVYGVAAAILGAFFLLALSFLVLLLVWDSPYRYAVIGGMALLYGVLALICFSRIKSLFAEAMPFSSTVQVFRDDVSMIKGELLSSFPASADGEQSASAAQQTDSREV
ncbi:MAG: phage holin family protein [Alcaligenaceae bacterium]|jgi:uncharacterized membrane protein YqjE|nr:phage holin family protein [Alcaligenaceae bacterium]